eukprot:g2199.t1
MRIRTRGVGGRGDDGVVDDGRTGADDDDLHDDAGAGAETGKTAQARVDASVDAGVWMRAWMRARARGAGGRGDDGVVDGGRTGADDDDLHGDAGAGAEAGKAAQASCQAPGAPAPIEMDDKPKGVIAHARGQGHAASRRG